MLVILPDARDGIRDLERDISYARLGSWTASQSRPREILVVLPRFGMTYSARLREALVEMGMRDAFSIEAADFTPMTRDPEGLFIGRVVHKAFVDVNEEGTEAAAATAVVKQRKSKTASFRADHPFLFAIRDGKTGAILFLGRCVRPGS
jgi:serpin B